MTTYQPFLDQPDHIRALAGQRFVVLRAPAALAEVYCRVQDQIRGELRGESVSYPATAHVTLCGFPPGTSVEDIQAVVHAWAATVHTIEIEPIRVTSFPAPFRAVIMEVRKTRALSTAMGDLRALAERRSVKADITIPLERWVFHMSIAYCPRLNGARWQAATAFAETLQIPGVRVEAQAAELVAFDEGREYSGGTYAFRGRAPSDPSKDAV